jgi:hypothetical protein
VPRAKGYKPKPKRRGKTARASEGMPLLEGEWKLRGRAARAHAAALARSEDDAGPWIGARLAGRLWNFIVGLSLLPFCWIFTDAIFTAFARAGTHGNRGAFWTTHEFLMFGGGAAVWLLWFAVSLWIWREPRPLRVYVWGHELMHVLTARLFGGTIKDYEISREGGYIVTDRYNFLIALAPYLWPFAAVPVLAAWGVVGWMPEALYYREWFLASLGFTWMFHLSFTAWMIPIGQTDFAGPGRVFSLGLIYLFNVVLLSACLVVLAPEVTWSAYWLALRESAVHFYQQAAHLGWALLAGGRM